MLGRAEENAYMMRMLKVAGHQNVKHIIFNGYGHGISTPALPLVVNEIKKMINKDTFVCMQILLSLLYSNRKTGFTRVLDIFRIAT